ncbi:hypothetical protein CR513_54080, partial [Mucuna pruriens]
MKWIFVNYSKFIRARALLISPGRNPGCHIHRVTPQDSQERRELLHLRQCILGPNLSHGSLKINVEQVLEVLRGSNVRIIHKPNRTVPVWPRLDLRQTNVPKRERGKHFEKHRSSLIVREHNARLERTVRARNDRLSRQHHESRHVARIVLNAVRHNVQPVKLRRARASDGRRVAEVVGGDELRGAGSVVDGLARHVDAEFRQCLLALRERLRMRYHAREEIFSDTREGEEAVVDRELDLADDVEAVAEEEVVVPVDRAAEGVFHREDGSVGDPELHRLERHLELVAGNGLAVRIGFAGGGFGVRAGNALVRHTELRAVHRRRCEVGDCQRFRRKRLVLGFAKVPDRNELEIAHGGFVAVDGGDVVGAAAVIVSGGLLLRDDLAG